MIFEPQFEALFLPQIWNCNHSEVQALYEKGLISPNSTQKVGEKMFQQCFWTILFPRSFKNPRSVVKCPYKVAKNMMRKKNLYEIDYSLTDLM